MADARSHLIAVLKMAYSGEKAACYAYRGHWRCVKDPEERQRIQTIEAEEWHHRELVGQMLNDLGARPSRQRELRTAVIGRVLQCLCYVTGWLAPMYGAGWLESHNVREYEAAANWARQAGREDLIDCLLTMAEVEWEHEAYFRAKVLSHRWGRRLKLWPLPPEKALIRAAFERQPAE